MKDELYLGDGITFSRRELKDNEQYYTIMALMELRDELRMIRGVIELKLPETPPMIIDASKADEFIKAYNQTQKDKETPNLPDSGETDENK